ncbi:MAG: undecaprenyldiphospho-muramoylpentapeptide beta-N-acetylglucosaminyltransferase [Aquiluna sp.]|nr:undecaprenyldiphospho-muramoylpentapeptide beta-N-acetylglucosaminyltransferase [Aquiluna sp.]MCF8544961.1 undecaprenyldiphospho-muramoylpentapeptide beta-N-acetylglucosaminyltransferase [Aquiluna sp.]
MTRFLLAGGGTGGHVNPMLALATDLESKGNRVICLGTKEGLESRLVPERGFELITIAKLPFPRKFDLKALAYPIRLLVATAGVLKTIRRLKIDAVVGFGGYASAPAYIAAWLSRTPLVIHEANALAGIANRLGAKLTKNVAVAFPNSDLMPAILTGMPIRQEIVDCVAGYDQGQARIELGLDPMMPTILVTGGSLGAKSINETVIAALPAIRAAGVQVLHIVGDRAGLPDLREPSYVRMAYCQRMDAAIAAANLAISRAGSSTVSEFAAVGLPAIYIPYPVGNGEQKFNAATLIEAGGGKLISDKDFSVDYVLREVIPLLSHTKSLIQMRKAAFSTGIPDATQRLSALVLSAVDTDSRD